MTVFDTGRRAIGLAFEHGRSHVTWMLCLAVCACSQAQQQGPVPTETQSPPVEDTRPIENGPAARAMPPGSAADSQARPVEARDGRPPPTLPAVDPGDAAGEGGAGGTEQGGAPAPADGDAPSDVDNEQAAAPPHPTVGWTMMGHDLASTYWNRAETRLSTDNATKLEVAWTERLGGQVLGAALQHGDAIYASSTEGVYAFDAATGDSLWMAPIPSTSALCYSSGRLLLNTRGGVVALDAQDGRELWVADLDPQQTTDGMGSVVVAEGRVLTGSSNGAAELGSVEFRGFVVALDEETGDALWRTYTVPSDAFGVGVWSTPSVDLEAGRVFTTTGNNYGPPATDTSDAFMAFDLKTGDLLWKNQRLSGDTFGGPRLSRGFDQEFGANPVLYEAAVDGVMTRLVAAGQKSGEFHALRRDDGEEVWSRALCPGSPIPGGVFTNSSWSGRYLLAACNHPGGRDAPASTLFALDGATGDVAWSRALPNYVFGRIAIANGVGAVGVGEALELFNTDTGEVLKRFTTEGTVASTITMANGRVAFGDGLTWHNGKPGGTLTVLSLPE